MFILCARGGQARELSPPKSLKYPEDWIASPQVSEILLLLMVRGKRELWMVSNQQMSAVSLKVALINVPAIL